MVFEYLKYYPGLFYTRVLGRIGISSFKAQTLVTGIFCAILMVIVSIKDNTLILSGKNRGLLEHPSIWAFIILQVVSPLALYKSLSEFASKNNLNPFGLPYNIFDKDFSSSISEMQTFVQRKTSLSQFLFNLFVGVGLIAFIWNSYQNQLPLKFLGFDFWDSFRHQWGYWVTRAYKLYLWAFLFPAVAHLYIGLILAIRKYLINTYIEKEVSLDVYHPDGCGGVRVFISNILRPTIPVMVIIGIAVAVVISIHHTLEITPIIGLIISCSLFIISYLIPASTLRRILIAEKKSKIGSLAEIQNSLLKNVLSNSNDLPMGYKCLQELNALEPIRNHILALPTWPHLKFIAKFLGIVLSPTFISLIIQYLIPWAGKQIQ